MLERLLGRIFRCNSHSIPKILKKGKSNKGQKAHTRKSKRTDSKSRLFRARYIANPRVPSRPPRPPMSKLDGILNFNMPITGEDHDYLYSWKINQDTQINSCIITPCVKTFLWHLCSITLNKCLYLNYCQNIKKTPTEPGIARRKQTTHNIKVYLHANCVPLGNRGTREHLKAAHV